MKPRFEVEMSREIMGGRYFKQLQSCFSRVGGPLEVVEARKNLWRSKTMFIVRSVCFGAKSELYERVLVSAVTFGAETWAMRIDRTQR